MTLRPWPNHQTYITIELRRCHPLASIGKAWAKKPPSMLWTMPECSFVLVKVYLGIEVTVDGWDPALPGMYMQHFVQPRKVWWFLLLLWWWQVIQLDCSWRKGPAPMIDKLLRYYTSSYIDIISQVSNALVESGRPPDPIGCIWRFQSQISIEICLPFNQSLILVSSFKHRWGSPLFGEVAGLIVTRWDHQGQGVLIPQPSLRAGTA